jgi:lysine-N-methylase
MTFKYVFPANGRRKLFDEFMMLAIHFAIVRFMLIGVYAAQPDTFDEAAIIECIQSFSKEVEHNAFFVKYIYDQLLANECNTLAKMALILHQV